MEPVKILITDVLDLHTFRPDEVSDLLDDYFDACIEAKIFSVRIIHGKGKGILKDRVRKKITQSPVVQSFKDAPLQAGGWGATLVELKRN